MRIQPEKHKHPAGIRFTQKFREDAMRCDKINLSLKIAGGVSSRPCDFKRLVNNCIVFIFIFIQSLFWSVLRIRNVTPSPFAGVSEQYYTVKHMAKTL